MNEIKLPEKMQTCLEKFTECLDKIMEEYEAKQPACSLYHYTSSEGLLGMLSSKELWLTHFSFLNDPSELKHGRERIINHANSFVQKTIYDGRLKYFWSIFPESFYEACREMDFYINSFSLAENDLTQWRSYANNGRGFCLEFTPNLVHALPNKYENGQTFFLKLRYEKSEIHDSCNQVISMAEEFVKQCLLDGSSLSDIEFKFIGEMHKEIATLALFLDGQLKHSCYESEKEFRFMWMGKSLFKPEFRLSSQGYLIPYIKLPLQIQSGEQLLKKVWIGPVNGTEPQALQRFLMAQGYEGVEVEKSNLPYRIY